MKVKLKQYNKDILYDEIKVNPKKEIKHTFLWYLNPIAFKRTIQKYEGEIDYKKILMYLLVYTLSSFTFSFFLNMTIGYYLIMYLSGLIFLPQIIIDSYKLKYINKRYIDANMYVKQLLSSFMLNKKIVTSLDSIKDEFSNSKMYECIDKTLDYILSYHNNCENEDVEIEGLKLIEKEYPFKEIKTTHQFLRKVEMIGGDFSKSISLLQENRSKWKKRILSLEKDKKLKKTRVIGAIIICSIVVIVFSSLIKKLGFDITHNSIVQIAAIIMWMLNMLVYCIADKKITTSEIDDTKNYKDEASLKRYYKIKSWDNKKEFKKSIIFSTIPFALTVIFFILGKNTFGFIFVLITIFMLFQHKIDYKLCLKHCNKELERVFPDWLMEIALLLQFENVYIALKKSIETAPALLKPEIEILCAEIENSPGSVEPFLEFMNDFDTTSISDTMKLLHSITIGIGESADEQIVEILRENNMLIEKNNELKDENDLAGYLFMFWAPGLIAGGKLIVDMFAFMILSMSDMSMFIK